MSNISVGRARRLSPLEAVAALNDSIRPTSTSIVLAKLSSIADRQKKKDQK
jgi:hypothetical protein